MVVYSNTHAVVQCKLVFAAREVWQELGQFSFYVHFKRGSISSRLRESGHGFFPPRVFCVKERGRTKRLEIKPYFKMADIHVFYYLQQPFTFSGTKSVNHLKLSTVLLFGFSNRSQFMFRQIFGWLVLEDDQYSHKKGVTIYLVCTGGTVSIRFVLYSIVTNISVDVNLEKK